MKKNAYLLVGSHLDGTLAVHVQTLTEAKKKLRVLYADGYRYFQLLRWKYDLECYQSSEWFQALVQATLEEEYSHEEASREKASPGLE